MVLDSRTLVDQSFHSVAKGTVKIFAFLTTFAGTLLSLAFSVGCSSTSKQPTQVAPSLQSLTNSSGLQITSMGQNSGGQFSIDGRRILFLSKERAFHLVSQVYEFNLDTFRERRITYNDGQTLEVAPSPAAQEIIYTSTTDEIKERPRLLNPLKTDKTAGNEYPPTDLYLSDLHGTEIHRLTKDPGFQGQVTWASPRQILFVSAIGSRLEIRSMALETRSMTVWRSDAHASLEHPTSDGTGTRIAWIVRKIADSKTNEPETLNLGLGLGLKIGGKISALPVPFEEIQSLQWIKGSQKNAVLLISARYKGEKQLRAWILDPEAACGAALFAEPGNLRDLRAGPRQEKLLFTFESDGKSQLYLREFPALPNTCFPLTDEALRTSATVKTAAGPEPLPKIQSSSVE